MSRSDNENSSNEDLSISFDQQQFNKIYTNQLKKKEKEKGKSANNQKDVKDINRKREGQPAEQSSSQICQGEINSNMGRLDQQQNSAVKQENQKQSKWHIYNNSDNLELDQNRFNSFILQLPIFKKKQKILNYIINNQVVLVTGETGCGKSTQVPRLLYEYIRETSLSAKIICVQPRRLAVKNLHKLLSDQIPERGAVGYHIAMQTNITQNTKILFMTNGIFLQRLVHGTQFFEQYPFIILDEVHERDIDTDFVLLSIKRIVRKHPKVRIILMSATIDNKLFQYYFAEDQIDNFLTRENYYKRFIKLEEKRMVNGRQNQEEQDYGYKVQRFGEQQQIYKDIEMQYLKSKIPCPTINVTEKGKYTKRYFYLDSLHQFTEKRVSIRWTVGLDVKSPTLNKQLYQVACSILEQILYKTTGSRKSESVLLFLPGLGQIEQLATQIQIYFGQKSSNFEIIKCHSSILNDQVTHKLHQQFPKKFKVIIATNIAESSITVFGIKYVIDFCLTKQIYFNQKSRMENLELVWASKASCQQRAGRTGRVCDGLVFRLVDRKFYDKFADYSTPQIQRSSLDKLILRIKLIHQTDNSDKLFEDPGQVLGTAIQPPNLKNIDESIKSLILCGGLKIEDDKLILTKMGRIYVDIPLDIIYSKMLIFAMLMGTYQDILILVCILSQNKNAFRKYAIQKNPIQYYEVMSNEQRCDFLSLVMAYKQKQRKINKRQYRNKRDQVEIDIYYQTKLLIEDVSRRIKQRNLRKKIYPNESNQNYFEKFKFTIAFGFLSNFIKVRPMVYDDKQEKRYKLMKRFGITVKNTVVLLNSEVIRKQNNQSVDERLKQTWINNIAKIFRINKQNIGMTLGEGLSYLHFKQQIDLNKFLFVNHIEKRKKQERSAHKHQKSKLSELLSLLGDIDYMEEGHTVQIHKQNKLTIDQYSSNRIIPVDKQNQSYQFPATRYALTNCITVHNLRLSCRFVSLLPDVTHIQLILHLLFYPFISLHPDKKRTRYNYLMLKKRGRLNINYELNDEQIQKANQIRRIIKQLMELQLFLEEQVDFDVIEPVRVTQDGRVIENERGREEQQTPQFSGKKRSHKRGIEPTISFSQAQERNRIINEDNQLIKREYSELTMKNQERQLKMKKFWPMLKQFILKERKGVVEQQRWQQLYFQEKKIQQKFSKVKIQKQEPQQFMNEIKHFDLRFSYFSSNYQYPMSRQQRIKDYENWKMEKYKSVMELESLATDHDPYIVCSECRVKIAKLNKIGPTNGSYFRELFEYYEDNVVKLPYSELGDYFCGMMMTIHVEKQYNVYGCKNNHIFAVKFQDQRKLKILNFSPISILYTDGSIDPEPQFSKIQYKFWRQKYERTKINKMKKPLQSKCFVCGDRFRNAKEVEAHVKLETHIANVRDFKLTFENKIQGKKEIKWQKGGPIAKPYIITSY